MTHPVPPHLPVTSKDWPGGEFTRSIDGRILSRRVKIGQGAIQKAYQLGGTEGYIAPEVLRLRNSPTRAADIYALGVLLWQLVTAESPNRCGRLNLSDNLLESVKVICHRCLADDPAQRYANIGEQMDDLTGLVKK